MSKNKNKIPTAKERHIEYMKKFPNLTEEQEKQLFMEYHNEQCPKESKKKEEYLLSCFMAFAYRKVRRFTGYGVDEMTLISCANLGLLEALRRFDYRRNIRFTTFSHYLIKKELWEAIWRESANVRIPKNSWVKINKLNKAEQRFVADAHREPTTKELAALLDWTPENVRKVRNDIFTYVPLERIQTEEEEDRGEVVYNQAEQLVDDNDPESIMLERERVSEKERIIRNLFDCLSPKERLVISYIFGFKDAPKSTKELEDRGIPIERISNIKSKAIRKMRDKGWAPKMG